MTARTYTGLAMIALAACGQQTAGDYAGGTGDAGAGLPECFTSSECQTGWTCSEFGTCVPPTTGDAGVEPPPEVEHELGQPVSGLNYVYVAMTELDALARIDGKNLEVHSVPVGDQPEVAATAPGTDTVVVLDSINGAAAIVRPTADEDARTFVPTLPALNRLEVSPDGGYAVAFFDLQRAIENAGGLDFVDRIGSFQDVTVIRLAHGEERAVDLTVGFRPRAIRFDDSGARAYVITADGVSVIDLAAAVDAGPTIVPPIPVVADPLADPDAVEVDITPTGAHAVVRLPDVAGVRVVELLGPDAGAARDVILPGQPTDVDLAPDGATAYAVLREAAMLAVIDVATAAGDGGVELVDLAGQVVGSLQLSADGARGLLFTNAFADERVTIIELTAPGRPMATRPLQKSVRAARFSPDGEHVLIVHARAAGDPDDATTFEEVIDRSHGYSLLHVASGFAKLQITPVDPGTFAFAPAAPRAYLALDGGDDETAARALHLIELDTGVVRNLALGTAPTEVGILPAAGVAFVSQRHPLGRVSFVDIATGNMRTVTGFDLNGRIID